MNFQFAAIDMRRMAGAVGNERKFCGQRGRGDNPIESIQIKAILIL